MQLTTERLSLRPPREDDLADLAGLYGDPEVMRYIGSGGPWTPQRTALALKRWMSFWSDDGFGMFVVTRLDDGGLVGDVGLLAWNPETWTPGSRARIGATAVVEIGWTLTREAWGQGYATEAATAVRDWARDELGLERLISLIQPRNAASIRVAEKLGARYEHDVVVSGQAARVYASGQEPAR
jgi:RimJ/RimL family protein N-acetyltransferase